MKAISGIICVFVLCMAKLGNAELCPDGWDWFQGQCYWFSDITRFRNPAANDCENMGSHLVTVDNEDVHQFLMDKDLGHDIWLGLRYIDNMMVEEDWRFSDGSETVMHMFPGEPSQVNPCTALFVNGDWFNIYACNRLNDYVCKKAKDGTCDPEFEYEFEDKCYFVSAKRTTNMEASLDCIDRGGALTSIHTVAENDYIKDNVIDESAWIGLFPIFWEDGTVYHWHVWDSDGPSGNKPCALMKTTTASGEWQALSCLEAQYHYVCQQAGANGGNYTTTTLDPGATTTTSLNATTPITPSVTPSVTPSDPPSGPVTSPTSPVSTTSLDPGATTTPSLNATTPITPSVTPSVTPSDPPSGPVTSPTSPVSTTSLDPGATTTPSLNATTPITPSVTPSVTPSDPPSSPVTSPTSPVSTTSPPPVECNEPGAEVFEGKCYIFREEQLTRPEASDACNAIGTNLVTIDIPSVFQYIYDKGFQEPRWIGLKTLVPEVEDQEAWLWNDGSPYDFNNWGTFTNFYPFTHLGANGQWSNQLLNNQSLPFTCKKPIEGANCEAEWTMNASNCYHYTPQKILNSGAALNCFWRNASLVSIHSQPELDFILNLSGSPSNQWIGLYPLLWDDSTTYYFHQFDIIGPLIVKPCVIHNVGNVWSAESCSEQHKYICVRAPGGKDVIKTEENKCEPKCPCSKSFLSQDCNLDLKQLCAADIKSPNRNHVIKMPDQTNCRKYHMCLDGYPTGLCPKGTAFDPAKQKCTFGRKCFSNNN